MNPRRLIILFFILAIFMALGIGLLSCAEQPNRPSVEEPLAAPLVYGCTTYSNNTSKAIPDNNATGITSTISLPPNLGLVSSLTMAVTLTHTYPRDLEVTLCQANSCCGQVFSRKLATTGIAGTGISFSDAGAEFITAADYPYAGLYLPAAPFNSTNGNVGGRWRLTVADRASSNTGTLDGWSITICTGSRVTKTPTSTVTPTPPATSTYTPAECAAGGNTWTISSITNGTEGGVVPVMTPIILHNITEYSVDIDHTFNGYVQGWLGVSQIRVASNCRKNHLYEYLNSESECPWDGSQYNCGWNGALTFHPSMIAHVPTVVGGMVGAYWTQRREGNTMANFPNGSTVWSIGNNTSYTVGTVVPPVHGISNTTVRIIGCNYNYDYVGCITPTPTVRPTPWCNNLGSGSWTIW